MDAPLINLSLKSTPVTQKEEGEEEKEKQQEKEEEEREQSHQKGTEKWKREPKQNYLLTLEYGPSTVCFCLQSQVEEVKKK